MFHGRTVSPEVNDITKRLMIRRKTTVCDISEIKKNILKK